MSRVIAFCLVTFVEFGIYELAVGFADGIGVLSPEVRKNTEIRLLVGGPLLLLIVHRPSRSILKK